MYVSKYVMWFELYDVYIYIYRKNDKIWCMWQSMWCDLKFYQFWYIIEWYLNYIKFDCQIICKSNKTSIIFTYF